jgi:hypothetical protein
LRRRKREGYIGHRANYVLIEGGQPTIFFSRWGAVVIPSLLLCGPEMTLAYVRGLDPDDDLLDDVWAEVGMVLNIDRHEVRFFGGEDSHYTPLA